MGKVICAGLGPGDPDLMSVKSDRTIRGAKHLAFFRKKGRAGQARTIVKDMLREDVIEYPMEYPVTTELRFDSDEYRQLMVDFYAEWADRLAELAKDHEVVVLCEGDPFFYGSFMHLHTRLQGRAEVEVLPAIPGMVGCWNALDTPFTWGDDVMTVLMATLPDDELVAHMDRADALVVMKTGRNMPRVRAALEQVGRLDDAWLVEKGTMPGQRVAKLADVDVDDCPYFAIVLVHGQGRRPEADT
ncbi:precorrin-2 C(20)-methyltransferase [Sulfitobacter mediterraneus]|jgi:precorrin-2/cobalt-factor-2 C20-methyltransferase|uniref:precorrin-2 C(20)-methyltransferase n=1 Tax=Sulfitobacter mediterraneus TaxID=83219 RepID=UPI0019327D71|nr:precorrin-2 C(20)-methyltransferase [Sulfitobacter mediterraneus]MBM1632787.1 precorrin-2 C(20)-methyltransferase [Sulfitobacter mediterraneus]MBM1641079.1 precorrin-2 C(20)-methyltransferase [Sulfitobacter mediterraneus]MBM1644652.1 precorrin-2 C(20)-methyltransferase [Sulfitobacter mediterraneus]MBM1649199.1 precorrin-2 C(20)-methyltransferase [Sulfitobacter mediterraneus]MBM1653220.1 precorrin-2 C(20)-methyltransferase [Sulfitobacter mediterraneus]